MRIVQATCLAFALASAGPAFADAETTVVFGLYDTDGASAPRVDPAAASVLGCTVTRSGRIVAQDGDIGLPRPNAFVLFTCSGPVLAASGETADRLVGGARRLALFEGRLTGGGRNGGDAALRNRQYIVKVSYFNNTDPAARQRDLAEIEGLVARRPDQYAPEAAIDVTRALGAPRPDDITVLYYDSADAGERFRSGNPDVMQMIGTFNSRHVTGFTYYVGIAEQ